MVRVDPPIDRWRNALSRPGATVATGHQAFLWHPGILTKLLAMQTATERYGCRSLYVVVDQDAHDALTLELPRVEGDRLHVDTVNLGEQRPDVPTGYQEPATLDLSHIPDGRVREALASATGETLAQQMTNALLPLIEPLTGKFDIMYVSDLSHHERYETLVQEMIDDAKNCGTAYNAALRETGLHDVAPLRIKGDDAELPLWSCMWGWSRQNVIAHRGELIDVMGQSHIQDADLLPKALTLSAVMRSLYSDLFIHGLGGEIYDRATEAWWRNWRGESLRPMAVATADLRLDFDAPVATHDNLARAAWRRHHLRHNPDPRKKAPLLARMREATDRRERAAVFKEIHRLNDAIIAADPAPLADADAALARARAGIANAALAAKRDWCVGLYPPAQLHDLRNAVFSSPSPLGRGPG